MIEHIKTAGIVIIGDEILSGRFEDQNSPFLIRELSAQGVAVQYCLTIPDNRDIISRSIRDYAARVTWLFTSGGIGPTPDDITMESIALAFDVPLIMHEEIQERIKTMYGSRCTQEHLRMARVPEGTMLLPTERPSIPVLQFQNITIFPGVPEFLKTIFNLIKNRFQGINHPVSELNLRADEGEITGFLQETLTKFPDLKLGSYPCYGKDGVRVKIVLEHENEENLFAAKAFLEQKVGRFLMQA